MKRRWISAVAAALVLIVGMAGCSAVGDAVAQVISGNVTGQVGKAYSTSWFNFTIQHIQTVEEYAGYTPAQGNKLIDVLISQTGTFAQPVPMGTYDFLVDQEELLDWIWPMDPIDDSMMPLEYTLGQGQSVEYHMLYEVPAHLSGYVLEYTEFDEDENEGATFTIPIAD